MSDVQTGDRSARWSGRDLVLLEIDTGEIRRVQGVTEIASAAVSEARAAELLDDTANAPPGRDEAFLEAARLIGCAEAARRLPALRR